MWRLELDDSVVLIWKRASAEDGVCGYYCGLKSWVSGSNAGLDETFGVVGVPSVGVGVGGDLKSGEVNLVTQ